MLAYTYLPSPSDLLAYITHAHTHEQGRLKVQISWRPSLCDTTATKCIPSNRTGLEYLVPSPTVRLFLSASVYAYVGGGMDVGPLVRPGPRALGPVSGPVCVYLCLCLGGCLGVWVCKCICAYIHMHLYVRFCAGAVLLVVRPQLCAGGHEHLLILCRPLLRPLQGRQRHLPV